VKKWTKIPIHSVYGIELPKINVIDLSENIAEKLSRVNRKLLARDIFDLVWLKVNLKQELFDTLKIADLTFLKIWVDNYAIETKENKWGKDYLPEKYSIDYWIKTIKDKKIYNNKLDY
jgi:predicted nucleotidyltransferase component of viral defense system